MEIKEIIKSARIEKRLTQKQLAEKMGVSQPQIADWENGKKRIYGDDFVKIIKVLNAENLFASALGIYVEQDNKDEISKLWCAINEMKSEYKTSQTAGKKSINIGEAGGDVLVGGKNSYVQKK